MLAVFGMGGGELILVMGAILILFGAKKIPEFAKGLGQGMREFRKASREVTEELENAMNTEAPPPPPKRVASAPESDRVAAETPSDSSPAAHKG